MKLRWLGLAVISLGLLLAQRPFRQYPAMEGAATEVPLPPDYQVKAELCWAG